MVQVSVSASVKVQGGPTVALGSSINPESYTFATVELDASGGSTIIALLPKDPGTVVLLGLSARTRVGEPATVTVVPKNGNADGAAFEVDGTLMISNSGVLKALVPGGPRTLGFTNPGPIPLTVDMLVCLDQEPSS